MKQYYGAQTMEPMQVFFSHSSKDDGFARRLVADLRAHLGDDAIWYDVSGGLHGGDEWWNRIVAEITARDTFLVSLSPDALTSDWVPHEMSIAYWQHVKLGKRLLPLMYRTCEPPADWQLIQTLPFGDNLPYEARLETLLRELNYTGPITITPQSGVSVPVEVQASMPPSAAPTSPRELLAARLTREVHTAFGRRDWRQTLLRARTLREEAPEVMTPPLWREWGLAAVELNDGATALTALDQALVADLYDVPTLRGKAQALILLKREAEAVHVLQRAQSYIPIDEIEPQMALLSELITLLRRQMRLQELLTASEHALNLDPTFIPGITYKYLALGFIDSLSHSMLNPLDHVDEQEKALCEQASAREPHDASDWITRGLALDILGRDEEASAAFDQALALDPRNAYTWTIKGLMLEGEDALASFDRALALDPRDAFAWFFRGSALANMNRLEEALASCDQALAINPQSGIVSLLKAASCLELGYDEEALAALEPALANNDATNDPVAPLAWELKGVAFHRLERFADALAAYRQSLVLAPRSSRVWQRMGNVLLKSEKDEEAIGAFSQAISFDPKDMDAWIDKGIALSHLERYGEALTTFDQAIALEIQPELGWRAKAITLRIMKRYDEALVAYRQAVALKPNKVESWDGMANILYLDVKRYDEALAAYNQIIALEPTNISAWLFKGGVLDAMKRPREALAAYDYIITLDPQHVTAWDRQLAWENKARTLHTMGRKAEARDAEIQAEIERKIAERGIP